jgi:hypothetical protein
VSYIEILYDGMYCLIWDDAEFSGSYRIRNSGTHSMQVARHNTKPGLHVPSKTWPNGPCSISSRESTAELSACIELKIERIYRIDSR